MTDQVVPVARRRMNDQQQQQGGPWAVVKEMLRKLAIFYFLSLLMKGFTGGGKIVKNELTANPFGVEQLYDFYLYLGDTDTQFDAFDQPPLWKEERLKYGDWSGGPFGDGSYMLSQKMPTPESLTRNGSLYLHAFIVKSGQSPSLKDRDHEKREVIYGRQQLNKYKKKYYKKTANLLTGKSEKSEEELAKADAMKFEILNFWHPNMTINLVDDHNKPILFFNDFWNLGSEYQPVNETVKELNLTITFAPISFFKYKFYDSQTRNRWDAYISGDFLEDDGGDGQDQMKQALLETSPILLAVTVIASLLHGFFEFQAFRADIEYWKSRKSLAGLSVRSVLFKIFQSAIVFLYICDNDTNFVVKFSVGIEMLIDCWKLPKVLNINVNYENKWLGLFPRVSFSDKGSYVESDTKIYDEMAFKYLSWALFPLLGGYGVYSMMYDEHRGWYSFVLSMLYGFLLTFGFIAMTPQLFINYKLKSVAHLPWRMLTYKFINTFIDDLFAFVIRMPTMYRIGCFSDDIVFLVYLYQRWVYRVDPKRTNEYGTSGENPTGIQETEGEEQETEGEEQKAVEGPLQEQRQQIAKKKKKMN